MGGGGRGTHLIHARIGAAVLDVVTQAVVEQDGVLRHDANRAAQAALRDVRNGLAINRYFARIDVIKTEQQAR